MAKSDMMYGIWNRVKVYCLNHEKPVPMIVISNTEKISSPFYACRQYLPEEGETPCANRLNLDDYQGIVGKFSDVIANESPFSDLTNYSFDYKGTRHKIRVTCIKYTDEDIYLGIINLTVMGKK